MKEDQARSNPGQSHVVQAGPNPKPMHEDFVAIVYPQVHEILKHTPEEHVHIENPLSSSGALSLIKNLADAFTFEPIFTTTTTTKTTTLLPPPPPQQQSTTDSKLDTRVSALEKICANFEKKTKLQDKTTQALLSRVYMLENHDLYLKIDKYINEVVKEAFHNAHQAPFCERYRDLSGFEMKEIIYDRMFESGSYRSHPEHTTLYEALKASMDRENMEEFNEEMAKSRKRRCDDQDPPPPPPKDSDQSKKKRHDSDALDSKQPSVQTSPAWKTSDTREAPSSSSKQKSASPSEQPVDDILIPDDVHHSDLKDTGVVHLPKIKTQPYWLKPLPEEEAQKTLEPDWVIPPNDLPKTEHNWVDTLAKTYKDPEEKKLLRKTRDMGSFINRYCKQIGKSKLVKADLEGPAYKLVRPFHKNSMSLQFQMEECHLLLTDQIDLLNPEAYDISHWWFKRKEFYIIRHSAPSNRSAVISHIKILSVVSLKTFSRYGYTYLKEIVLRRADYKEYNISEADFKNLHSNDFEDLYLLHLQGKLNHLSGANKVHLFNAVNLWIRNILFRQRVEDLQLGIESYQTKLNLTQPSWDATDFLFKEDYTIVQKPRAVIYKDRNNQKKMMRGTEVYKFSDDTLTRIIEKLDVMVKVYVLFKFNPVMEHRIWSEDDK
ncbi:hypothetical protein Tco_0016501 [Tanacetum coccineum]